jgi:hypothetical protein
VCFLCFFHWHDQQNLGEDPNSGENQLSEVRAQNVIIDNTNNTVDVKIKPQPDETEIIIGTNTIVETDGGSVGQVD